MQAFGYQKIVMAVTKCPIRALGWNLSMAAATNSQSEPKSPRRRPMDKIENSQVERVLRNDELDTVSGGVGFGGLFTNPLVIHGFNPQPDPPAMPVAR
jgi:hypothetical protein